MRFLCRARQWGPYVPAAALGGPPGDREGERRAFVREVMEVMFGADGADEYDYEYEEGDEDAEAEAGTDAVEEDEGEESVSSGAVVYRGDEDDDEARAEESDDGAEKPALYLYDDSSDAHESYSDDTGDSDDTNDVDDAHLPGSLDDKWRIGSWAGTATLPLAAGLRPDWAFLCAVRVVVEANMREAVGARELGGLLALDALRTGSAPLDARSDGDAAWFAGAAKAGAGFADGMWDWAGVTGVWRPVFIASDKAHVSESTLREAVRIVPLRLRVIAHGAPAVPAWPGRPTLYVEGETSGSSQNGAIRRVRGTVSALADGSARWSLGLLGADDGHEQWMSEGVQLGGPSSSMGVLGLWTGSQHERTDPGRTH
ncbi:hypothetical protein POSPLADRAFT_1046422 [Postia placenta MAD-698-R-SB12]|uniref:Uncharacterized protein n=1 Tax=Postia placenta MAD-698-R-SB12 TaxID=670580 RepID=A0A1X6N3B6_9APHY|nr:hypothetical protein POSPLADRAFT_1046422 [Postia placenta MAD-698-R-SB12]OSX63117.1 hypothetical protein POSPLADRAFT_1046422 [Postia placenta MAD-698-R-SB12]